MKASLGVPEPLQGIYSSSSSIIIQKNKLDHLIVGLQIDFFHHYLKLSLI